MRRLLGFIFDNRDWFSLFLASVLSLALLNNNDSPNLQILRGKVNSVVSILFIPVNWVQGIGTLKEKNAALESRIMQLSLLNSQLINYKEDNERLRSMLQYKESGRLSLIAGRVISTGLSPLMTAVNVQVGAENNLRPNLAVVNTDGVVGKTISVGPSSVMVQLMTDYSFRLSVRIERSGTVGILRWHDKDQFEVWEIPRATEVEIGDRIVTSGYSDIFPPNLPVGTVTGIIDRPDMLHKIALTSVFTDFTTLGHLFIVKEQDG
ncbi:MAG: rod shape-determining protein MreC [Candidatus Marinimicrobia bacterium]|nr:rod shape-determining protein MreC [Candidatus Neomarinimicrobiota bacterium]|tara:strand:- start:772 stop:1563 length:792 start_codon:yes stop_codon:yes gene_type:complete